nr:MMPL family transporter [Mycobacterium tuberculosis]
MRRNSLSPNTTSSTVARAAPTYRDSLPAFALPGACVAIFTGPLLLARTPALHGVGTAGLGVFVALAAIRWASSASASA